MRQFVFIYIELVFFFQDLHKRGVHNTNGLEVFCLSVFYCLPTRKMLSVTSNALLASIRSIQLVLVGLGPFQTRVN